MSSTTDRFKHESLEDSVSIGKYLDALKEGFENGALQFSTDSRRLEASPQGLIHVEIEARRKNGEVKLSLKFRWTEGPSSDRPKPGTLSIKPMGKE